MTYCSPTGQVLELRAAPMVWQFWFGICCCLPTPNCKCKGKNMAIPNGLAFWTWQLPNGDRSAAWMQWPLACFCPDARDLQGGM